MAATVAKVVRGPGKTLVELALVVLLEQVRPWVVVAASKASHPMHRHQSHQRSWKSEQDSSRPVLRLA